MNIQKNDKQTTSTGTFDRYIGVGEFSVIALNPTKAQKAKMFGIEENEETEEPSYEKETKDGDKMIICNFWLQNVQEPSIIIPYRVNLIDKIQESKTGKTQYINAIGESSYVDHVDNLTQRFTKFTSKDKKSGIVSEIGTKAYREAHTGEAELHAFIKAWVNLRIWNPENDILLDWKKLVKGNLSEIKEIMGTENAGTVICMAEVRSTEKDGETKFYQNVCGRYFLPGRLMPAVRNALFTSKWVGYELEHFNKDIAGEHGSKNIIKMALLTKFVEEEYLQATNEPMQHSDSTEADTDY